MESADLATGRDCHAASPLAAAPDHAHLASEPVIRHLVGTVQHAFESAEHAACANHRSVIASLPGLSAGRRMMEGMNALIGIRIELRDAQGMLVGAVYCEDQLEAVSVPQRGDRVALTAIAGLPASDSSLAERQSVLRLADAFPFMTVDHLEHYPTADHQVGEQPSCMVILHGCARGCPGLRRT